MSMNPEDLNVLAQVETSLAETARLLSALLDKTEIGGPNKTKTDDPHEQVMHALLCTPEELTALPYRIAMSPVEVGSAVSGDSTILTPETLAWLLRNRSVFAAAQDRGDLPAPEKPSEALLAAARAVLAANGEDVDAFRDCSHPNCEKHGKSPCEGIDCHGNEIPEVDVRGYARSVIAYTPEQLAEAGIV